LRNNSGVSNTFRLLVIVVNNGDIIVSVLIVLVVLVLVVLVVVVVVMPEEPLPLYPHHFLHLPNVDETAE
jgi:hypothetical protein